MKKNLLMLNYMVKNQMLLLDIRKVIPGSILSFIPGDFDQSLDTLEKQIDDK